LKTSNALDEWEGKRIKNNQKNKKPFTWNNVSIKNLALEAVYKVNLGLDALMKNHVHPVPYYNKKTGKYDVNLQTGYKGLKYVAKNYAIDPPKDIVIELVHKNDHFKPLKSNFEREVESYEFEIENPFNRGAVVGGFGYLVYDDPTKNELIIVTNKEFEKAQNQSPMDLIWNKHEEKMKRKTVVRRTMDHIDLDPKKINAKVILHEDSGNTEAKVDNELNNDANAGEVLDITEEVEEEFRKAEESKDEQPEQEEEKPKEKQKLQQGEIPMDEKPTGTEGPDFG